MQLLIGSYTSGTTSPGVVRADLDLASGALTASGAVALQDPSWTTLHDGVLHAVGEDADGTVSSVRLDDGRTVTLDGAGDHPCHALVHQGHLLVAGYGSGTVAVYALDDDGLVRERTQLLQHSGSGPDADRQEGPHVHQVQVAPDGRFVLVNDLGTDTVTTYRLAEGRLRFVSVAAAPPGSGPRHLTFHPGGRAALLSLELGDAVAPCLYEPGSGALTIGTPVPTGAGGAPSEVVFSADGHHAYVGVRGPDVVAHVTLAVGGAAVRVAGTHPAGGAVPRHQALTPDGRWLLSANQDGGSVTVLPVEDDGSLGAVASSLTVPGASCVAWAGLPG